MDFLNAYRLKVSCNLLDATDKSITEIAFACGFNHLSYFSKTFSVELEYPLKDEEGNPYIKEGRYDAGKEEEIIDFIVGRL